MKHQFYFDHVERDLLITALEFFYARLDYDTANGSHEYSKRFTRKRICEMLARLKAPDTKKAAQ